MIESAAANPTVSESDFLAVSIRRALDVAQNSQLSTYERVGAMEAILQSAMSGDGAGCSVDLLNLARSAKSLLGWIETQHRPPVADRLEIGCMVGVRLHALVDLRESVEKVEVRFPGL